MQTKKLWVDSRTGWNFGQAAYMPALRFHWLTPWYDFLSRCLLPEYSFKLTLIRQVKPQPGEVILDFGCGTGTLSIWTALSYPSCQIHGLDADPKVIQLAKHKLNKEQITNLHLHAYQPPGIPFPDHTFDQITSSLVFCNLTPQQKVASLTELRRVLKPGGKLHVAEWGKPTTIRTRLGFSVLQWWGGYTTTQDLAMGVMLPLLAKTGFPDVGEMGKIRTLFGEIYFYQAS